MLRQVMRPCLRRQPQADALQFSPQVQQALQRYQSQKSGRSSGNVRGLKNYAEGQRERRSPSPAKQHLIVSVMTGQAWHMEPQFSCTCAEQ